MGRRAKLPPQGSSLQTVADDVRVMDEVRFVQIHPSMVEHARDKIVAPDQPASTPTRTLETRMRHGRSSRNASRSSRLREAPSAKSRCGKFPREGRRLAAAAVVQGPARERPDRLHAVPGRGAGAWAVKVAKGDMRKVLDAVEAR